jgi:hypothetical protein
MIKQFDLKVKRNISPTSVVVFEHFLVKTQLFRAEVVFFKYG